MSKVVLQAISTKLKQLAEFSDFHKLTSLNSAVDALLKANSEPDNSAIQSINQQYAVLIRHYAQSRVYQKSALMHAAQKGYLDLMADLLGVPGINIDEQFEPASGWSMLLANESSKQGGYTALMFAVIGKQKAAVDLLIRHYADTQITNDKGQKAVDLVNDDEDGISPFAVDPLLLQKEQLLLDLINCNNEERFAFLREKQSKLKITKEEIVQHMLFDYSDDHQETVRVLNQAVDLDESCTAPASFLAKYMREDQITIARIEDRIAGLDAQQVGVQETYLLRGRGISAELKGMLNYGPQTAEKEHLNVNNSKFF